MSSNISEQLDKAARELEASRKKAWKNFYVTILSFIVIVLSLQYLVYKNEFNLVFTGIICALGLISGSIVLAISYNKIKKTYKTELVHPMIGALYPHLKYSPKQFIDQNIFRKSKLFEYFNQYSGDDFFYNENESFMFSELNVTQLTSNGKSTTTTPIFIGVFIYEKLTNYIETDFWISANHWERALGKFGKKFRAKKTKKGEVVEVNNQEFGRLYTLRAHNPHKVKQVLSDDFHKTIINLREELLTVRNKKRKRAHGVVKDLHIAYIGNEVFIAISGVKLFQIPFVKPVSETIKRFSENTRIINLAQELKDKILR